jgi:hypothetical protein
MSYLSPLRLHFSGKFQANVSTVNNDPGHYDNSEFKPEYQQMTDDPTGAMNNGWFNPQGDAAWRLIGCQVTSAWLLDADRVAPTDPILQLNVADSDSRTCGKLADLDPEQQMVSTIFGFQVRLADSEGNTFLRGDYVPAAFLDIWDRALPAQGGDNDAGACYQSVLENLQWGDVSISPFLTELKDQSSKTGKLSIKFNVYAINLDWHSADFMCGRIIGTIGPAYDGEPDHLVLGRQFMATPNGQGNFFTPTGGINFFPGLVDVAGQAVTLDLGNALSTNGSSTTLIDLGDLTLQAINQQTNAVVPLGTISAHGAGGYAGNPDWYPKTAGIVRMPLTADQVQLVQQNPLSLVGQSATISEEVQGRFVRADSFVARMSPGDTAHFSVYATQFGQPFAGAAIAFFFDASQLQAYNGIDPSQTQPVSTPLSALTFPSYAIADNQGKVDFVVTGSDPGNPRKVIDGQVYGIRPALVVSPATTISNQWNFISILLWDEFDDSKQHTWVDGIGSILIQYGNLYPVMSRFLDLTDYESVKANVGLLSRVFRLGQDDPNAMPVTRDLSPAKRKAILTWLRNPLYDEKGSNPPERHPASSVEPTPSAPPALTAVRGGKAAAASRRLAIARPSPR